MKKNSIIITLLFALVGCNKTHYYVYSPDRKQCITIITDVDTRYIINGKYNSIPKTNFLQYSLDSIDVETGDEIVGHWKNGNYQWEIATDKAIILEDKLDKKEFIFKRNLPVDSIGIPTLKDFTDKNSFEIGFDHGKIIYKRGAIIE